MRTRLRDMPSQHELSQLYATPHRHDRWADHRVRVDTTIALARHMIEPGDVVADLSCGDAAIANALAESHQAKLFLGDYAPGYELTGPIEQTINQLDTGVDLFICSETIEHLADPEAVLKAIRGKTSKLILSTPEGETRDIGNPEHVWGWDAEAVELMLTRAGFTPLMFNLLDLRPAGFVYAYQIWCCR
jgi:hypothetical protein